jgi:hypothetical protein
LAKAEKDLVTYKTQEETCKEFLKQRLLETKAESEGHIQALAALRAAAPKSLFCAPPDPNQTEAERESRICAAQRAIALSLIREEKLVEALRLLQSLYETEYRAVEKVRTHCREALRAWSLVRELVSTGLSGVREELGKRLQRLEKDMHALGLDFCAVYPHYYLYWRERLQQKEVLCFDLLCAVCKPSKCTVYVSVAALQTRLARLQSEWNQQNRQYMQAVSEGLGEEADEQQQKALKTTEEIAKVQKEKEEAALRMEKAEGDTATTELFKRHNIPHPRTHQMKSRVSALPAPPSLRAILPPPQSQADAKGEGKQPSAAQTATAIPVASTAVLTLAVSAAAPAPLINASPAAAAAAATTAAAASTAEGDSKSDVKPGPSAHDQAASVAVASTAGAGLEGSVDALLHVEGDSDPYVDLSRRH